MYKILAACGAGMGSSMIIKMKIKNVFDKLGLEAEIIHESLGTAQSSIGKFDIIFTLAALAENFPPNSKNIVGLKNVMSESEIEEAVHRILGV